MKEFMPVFEKRERIEYFDSIKAIAIVMVLIGHILLWTFEINDSIILTLFSAIELPVIFYIAGYFCRKTHKMSISDGALDIARLFMRYMIPMLSVGFLSEVVTDYPFLDSLLHRGGGRYWFLYALFVIGSIGTICDFVAKGLKFNNFIIDLIIYGIPYVLVLILKFLGIHISSLIPIGAILAYYPFYILGILAGKYRIIHTMILQSRELLLISIIGIFFGTVALRSITNIVLSQAVALCAIVLMFQVFSNISYNKPVPSSLSKIGRSTLSIYLLHYFFIFDMKWMTPYLTTDNSVVLQLLVPMCISVLIIYICIGIEWVLKRTRFTSFCFLGRIRK